MQLFSTIRLKTKTNCDLGTRVFLRFRQLAFDFSLALRDIFLLSRKALYCSEVQTGIRFGLKWGSFRCVIVNLRRYFPRQLMAIIPNGVTGRLVHIPVGLDSWFVVECAPILLRRVVDSTAQDWVDLCRVLSVILWTVQVL